MHDIVEKIYHKQYNALKDGTYLKELIEQAARRAL